MKEKQSDNHDIGNLFRYNYRPLCLYALHYVEDMDLVEDLVDDAFELMWIKVQEGADIPNKRAYLYAAVRNRCLDHLRKNKLQTVSLEDKHDLVDESKDALYQKDSSIEAQLWTAIGELPEKCQEIFLMNKRDGMKYNEISDELGLSVNTVRNQIAKAIKFLKESPVKFYNWILSLVA